MKYIDEFRDPARVHSLVGDIYKSAQNNWTIMEICGGQTHAIVRFGLDQLLPQTITLVHGPGCPVCVTPVGLIDQAISLALEHRVILCSFGDMMRVPGSSMDLNRARSQGADVRMVVSPLDALKVADANPHREVVFFAVGFETTAPANAMAVLAAQRAKLTNFAILCAHVRVPPAIEAILGSVDNTIAGFLAAGHVCAIMGTDEYQPLVDQFQVPIVATGFEPVDILEGILMCVSQLEAGAARLEIQYRRAVRPEGNVVAKATLSQVFQVEDRQWRGLGVIARSGLKLRPEFAAWDASRKFSLGSPRVWEPGPCIAGDILVGKRKPHQCSQFGKQCTPETPLGAPMVSSEGACAAYYRYRSVF